MPTPRLSEVRRVAPAAIIVLAATLLVVGFGVSGASERSLTSQAAAWRGLVGGAAPARDVGQRMLVVLKAPSLATRVAANGGFATQKQEHEWTRDAIAAQQQLARRAERPRDPDPQGVQLRPRPERILGAARRARGRRHREPARGGRRLPGARGVPGLDLVASAREGGTRDRRGTASVGVPPRLRRARSDDRAPRHGSRQRASVPARADPSRGQPRRRHEQRRPGRRRSRTTRRRLEQHGTEMAGLLVGAGGPGGISGVATGASVLPIRVAGWQRDLTGGWAIYGRTDQLIAGLERAVDPNLDGDAHDAARIALIGLASLVRGLRRRARGAGDPGRAAARHARRRAGRERRARPAPATAASRARAALPRR